MSIETVLKSRYACRSYGGKPVEEEKLQLILEAAHVAPSAHNFQPLRLLVIRTEEGQKALGKAANTYGAPVSILVLADHDVTWKRGADGKDSADIDAAIATDHMMLQAAELGLASVWICDFKPEILKREFSLGERLEPVNILAIGYTDKAPADPARHAKTRKPLADLVSYR